MSKFCPLTGWGFLLICPEIPAQLNSNFHSISCTVDFIPSHKEMPLSHWQAETERLWPLASIPIFPKEKHSLGWSTGFPLPCWRSSCWLEHSETSSRGCREIPLGCAFIFLLGVKVGRNKGETVPNGIPHFPFQKGNISGINSIAVACSSSAQAGKALTCAYFTNSNCTPAWFGYFGVMFANKKEKTAWAERIWWLHNYFGADLSGISESKKCPRHHKPGHGSHVTNSARTLQSLLGDWWCHKAAAEQFTAQAQSTEQQMGLRAQRG